MKKPSAIRRDLPDVERETRQQIHNDQGSTQQMPSDDPQGRAHQKKQTPQIGERQNSRDSERH